MGLDLFTNPFFFFKMKQFKCPSCDVGKLVRDGDVYRCNKCGLEYTEEAVDDMLITSLNSNIDVRRNKE